jgi:hypothetical protein
MSTASANLKIMRTIATLFFIVITFTLEAQKLPNVQQISVKAPTNIKIDGKASEWSNKFGARNANTELFYTMANDDKKLYLVVQTQSYRVMNRIASGGIKLVIQKNRTKNDSGAPFVKFPYLEKPKQLNLSFVNISKVGSGTNRVDPKSPQEAAKVYDSLARNINKILTSQLKLIYVDGIAGIDNLLPVYNDKGVQAANLTDSKKNYTCEIAIDLKLLDLEPDKAEKFSYHIVVNGEPKRFVHPVLLEPDVASGQIATPDWVTEVSATTDFWGEYTLAK